MGLLSGGLIDGPTFSDLVLYGGFLLFGVVIVTGFFVLSVVWMVTEMIGRRCEELKRMKRLDDSSSSSMDESFELQEMVGDAMPSVSTNFDEDLPPTFRSSESSSSRVTRFLKDMWLSLPYSKLLFWEIWILLFTICSLAAFTWMVALDFFSWWIAALTNCGILFVLWNLFFFIHSRKFILQENEKKSKPSPFVDNDDDDTPELSYSSLSFEVTNNNSLFSFSKWFRSSNFVRFIWYRKKLYFICLILLLLSGILFPLLNAGCCIAERPMSITTRMSRKINFDFNIFNSPVSIPSCPNNHLCTVYLLASPEQHDSYIIRSYIDWNPSTQGYFVPSDSFVYYHPRNDNTTVLTSPIEVFEWQTKDFSRMFFKTVVSNLLPSKEYMFQIKCNFTKLSELMESDIKQFVSPPAFYDPFVLITSGDMGTSQVAFDMAKQVTKIASEFYNNGTRAVYTMWGGDLAYANNMGACYLRWDEWFELINTMKVVAKLPVNQTSNYVNTTQQNEQEQREFLIPMIISIGNHESGLDVPANKINFYYRFFTDYHFAESSNSNLNEQGRIDYGAYEVGNSVIFNLDSGDSSSVDGKQLVWMNTTMRKFREMDKEQHRRRHIMTLYHIPVFGVFIGTELKEVKEMRQDWPKIFQENQVALSFENHEHRYFRMKEKLSRSTVYFGGGAFGVPPTMPANDVNWENLVTIEKTNYITVVTTSHRYCKAVVLGLKERIIDHFSVYA